MFIFICFVSFIFVSSRSPHPLKWLTCFQLEQVENQLPEKIERLIRCEASAYQKLLIKRVEDNLGSLGNPKVVFFAYLN